MNQPPQQSNQSRSGLQHHAGLFVLKLAAGGLIPAEWYGNPLPPPDLRAARRGHLQLEIVSHCWQYAHLLVYQLSSLALHPPVQLTVTMTVYYCPDDSATRELLRRFSLLQVPGVHWNWQPLPRQLLFRRAIGRNRAALASTADWVWFTDCDLIFGAGCLDSLATALQGSRDALVFPAVERCTSLLSDEHPLLNADLTAPLPMDLDLSGFTEWPRSRATGPLQIAHGDVARACGYCNVLTPYQQPADAWCKSHEDRAFRWLLKSQGVPLDIAGVYRIRHASKGRYTGSRFMAGLRGGLRRLVSRMQESWRA